MLTAVTVLRAEDVVVFRKEPRPTARNATPSAQTTDTQMATCGVCHFGETFESGGTGKPAITRERPEHARVAGDARAAAQPHRSDTDPDEHRTEAAEAVLENEEEGVWRVERLRERRNRQRHADDEHPPCDGARDDGGEAIRN